MPIKDRIRPSFRRTVSVLSAVLLHAAWMAFLSPVLAMADAPATEKSYYDAAEVVIGGNNNGFVAGEGESIHISAGYSVRLLPGTHLLTGAQVIIEAGKQIPMAEEARECLSILRNPEMLVSKFSLIIEGSFDSDTEKQSVIGIYWGLSAVVHSGSGTNLLVKYRNSGGSFIQLYGTAVAKNIFTPDLTWGSRPENIRVMRT